jgi:CRP/FNR family transcriptional regulator, anaerobic regulatory protein
MSFATYDAATAPIRFAPLQVVGSTQALAPLTAQCSSCHLRELCLPCGLTDLDVDRLDSLGFGRRRLKAGQTLYRGGDTFRYIYAVRSGTFKSSLTLADGREQVSGFHMAGEMVGLDAVAYARHASDAIALEDSEICAIPYASLMEQSVDGSGLQQALTRLMSREIVREHSLLMLLGSMSAEERLAAFLMNLSLRLKALGYSSCEFHLRMSRAEIGSYLGLKLETVSRTFSAFAHQGLLEVDKRHIRIVNPQRLLAAIETKSDQSLAA